MISEIPGETKFIAIDDEGNLWTCGNNRSIQLDLNVFTKVIFVNCGIMKMKIFRQLGLNDELDRKVFTQVPNRENFIMVSCGYHHTAAIDVQTPLTIYKLYLIPPL